MRPGPRRLAVVALVAFVAVTSSCAPAPGASPRGAESPRASAAPVVVVPGWELGCFAKPNDWDSWRDAFVARGQPVDQFVVVRYNSCQSNLVTAEMIGSAVDELRARAGVDRVHLVAHSMGAISARWCLSYGRCVGKVDQLVTLAGANHGTIWAGACALQFWAASCRDMQPGSAMLNAINREESPAGVGVETWVSPCEVAIVPRESTFLRGAVNHDLVDQCVDHSGWKWFQPTIRAVAERLRPENVADGVSTSP